MFLNPIGFLLAKSLFLGICFIIVLAFIYKWVFLNHFDYAGIRWSTVLPPLFLSGYGLCLDIFFYPIGWFWVLPLISILIMAFILHIPELGWFWGTIFTILHIIFVFSIWVVVLMLFLSSSAFKK